jgi:hypothetical protein
LQQNIENRWTERHSESVLEEKGENGRMLRERFPDAETARWRKVKEG